MNYEIVQVMTTRQRYKGELATPEYLPEVYVIPLFLGSQKIISPNLAEKLFQNRMPQPEKAMRISYLFWACASVTGKRLTKLVEFCVPWGMRVGIKMQKQEIWKYFSGRQQSIPLISPNWMEL